jgi:hypothetical protein
LYLCVLLAMLRAVKPASPQIFVRTQFLCAFQLPIMGFIPVLLKAFELRFVIYQWKVAPLEYGCQ